MFIAAEVVFLRARVAQTWWEVVFWCFGVWVMRIRPVSHRTNAEQLGVFELMSPASPPPDGGVTG